MLEARLKRLEGAVGQAVEGQREWRHLLSCLEEATSLCQVLEKQRDELGGEILQIRKARTTAQSYIQTIELFKKRG